MIKRFDNLNTYRTTTESGAEYLVTLERIHNTASGAPRFRALVYAVGGDSSAVYTFSGHYMREADEARHIAEAHERREG